MAATDKQPTSCIAFTLPLSCQICLGKVKLPVVCPNQHVFCSPCMDVWLQRNQQCPSCRVPITSDNPCKKILGGLTQNEEEQNSFAQNKALRRSRLELLCKDYEDEIERLQMENDLVRHEKKLLDEQVHAYANQKLKDAEDNVAKGKPFSLSVSPSQPDTNMLMMLTKKLQDATELYERVKKDIDKLKKENADMKDENAALTRENQRVRVELTGRSPRKFGRVTVTMLETKLEKSEKDMKQLQKALERSDAYIEEVEKELDAQCKKLQQQNTCFHCKCTLQVEKSQELDGNEVKKGSMGHKGVEISKVEAPSYLGGQLKQQRASDCSVVDSFQVPLTSNDAWRKLPADIRAGSSGGENKHLKAADVSKDEKKSVTIASFYGKRPIHKEDQSGHVNRQSSLQNTRPEKVPDKLNDTSFDLEMPSPTSSSVVSSTEAVGRLNLGWYNDEAVSTSGSKNLLSNDSTGDLELDDTMVSASSTGSCKKRLRFASDASDVLDTSVQNGSKKGKSGKKSSVVPAGKQVTFNNNVAIKNMIKTKNALSDSLLDVTLPSDTSEVDILNDIKSREQNGVANESYDANMSMNSDIMDCMELFSGAERRLGQLKHSDEIEHHVPPHTPTLHESTQNQLAQPPPEFLQTLPMMPSHHHQDRQESSSCHDSLGWFPGCSSGGNSPPAMSNRLPSSSTATKDTNARTYPDSVSSSVHPCNSYMPSSTRSYSSEHVNPTSSRNEHPTEYTKSVSSAGDVSSAGLFSLPPQHSHSSHHRSSCTSNTGSSSTTSGYSSTAGGGISSLSSGCSVPFMMGQGYLPPRPASTSTLQGMIHTLNSLEAEAVRPLSAPGPQPPSSSHPAAPSWRSSVSVYNPISASTYNPITTAGGISSTTSDFQPSSLHPTTSSRGTRSSLFAISQSTLASLPGGAEGFTGSQQLGSQSSLTGLSSGGLPGIPLGHPPLRPGDSGLSQPTGQYGGDFGSAGMFGLDGGSCGFMPGFGGSLTQ